MRFEVDCEIGSHTILRITLPSFAKSQDSLVCALLDLGMLRSHLNHEKVIGGVL